MADARGADRLDRAWLAGQTTADAERILVEHHVVTGVVKSIADAARQPQVVARELTKTVDDPVLGRIEVVNSALKYRNSEATVRGHAPTLGEHNAAVLQKLLGYSPEQIEALQAKGVLKREAK